METLERAVINRKTPFVFGDRAVTKGRVVSLRVSGRMEQLLEKQAEEWKMSISDTLRSLLNFYYLPVILKEAWEKRVEELIRLDTEVFGESEADMKAPLLAQRIEPILIDSDEAVEYANFISKLFEENMNHYQTMKDEAILMNKIASKKLLETAERMESLQEKMKKHQ